MKKRLILSISILFAGALLFAQAAEGEAVEAKKLTDTVALASAPAADIEAEGKVTWGVDLGSGKKIKAKHGFKNQASWKVKFPLIKKNSFKSKSSESPVYGEVTLKDVEMNILSKSVDADNGKPEKKPFYLDGKVKKISAKVVFFGAYMTVYNAPSFKTNYAQIWVPQDEDEWEDDDYKFEDGFKGEGVKLGYANEDIMDLDVGLKFGSNGNWEAKDEIISQSSTTYKEAKFKNATSVSLEESQYQYYAVNSEGYYPVTIAFGSDVSGQKLYKKVTTSTETVKKAPHSKYGMGFDFSMKPLANLLGIKFNFNVTFAKANDYKNGISSGYDNEIVFGLGTELTSNPIDGLNITLGFDMGGKKGGSVAYDLMLDTKYKWVRGGLYFASKETKYGDSVKADKGDMGAYVEFKTVGDKDKDAFLLEGLDAGVYLAMHNLLTFSDAKKIFPLYMKVWGAYKYSFTDSMWIKPFVDFWGETNHMDGTEKYFGLAYDLGVTFSPVEKVEFTAKWAQGKTDTKNKHSVVGNSLITKTANKHQHNGLFTLACKVKW